LTQSSWLKGPGMRIKAYIDTNVFVYAVIHHPELGEACSEILRDFKKEKYSACGSLMVAVELLGSLSRIDPIVAGRAVKLYLALGLDMLPLNVEVLGLASLINEEVNVGYDAVHAAIMMLNSVPVILTNDVDDWLKLSKQYSRVSKRAKQEGYDIRLEKLEVVAPKRYSTWIKTLIK